MPRKADKAASSRRKKTIKQSTTGKPSAHRGTPSETFESKPRKAVPVKAQAGIPQATGDGNGKAKPAGALRRAVSAVKRVLTRGGSKKADAQNEVETLNAAAPTGRPSQKKKAGNAKAARVARRESDIPREVLDNTYTPPLTSAKASFRSDGADHQHDQEFAAGVADERWNDEDRFTNKSNDPRIGTHGRTYEPGEARATSRNE